MLLELDYLPGQALNLEVPASNLLEPKINSVRETEQRSLVSSLVNPENSPPFLELAFQAESIVFIVEDHTRHSPVLETLDCLKALFEKEKLPWNRVTLLVATGTHRKMTKMELVDKFGSSVFDTKIIQHEATNEDSMKDYGSYAGVPLKLNRFLEADLTVSIGSIVPHRFSGWSGGAKMVVPGVASYETVFESHRMAILKSEADVGVVENEFRDLIDETGKRVGLDFIINYYYGLDGEVRGCVAGHHVQAHRTGVKLARKELLSEYPQKSDVTVISSYPSTTDFWQGGKALYTADLLTKDGGDIVVVSPLEEGFGDHPLFASLLHKKSTEILVELDRVTTEDPLAYVAAYAVKSIMERKKIHLISDTKHAWKFEKVGLKVRKDLQVTLDQLIGKNTAVAVMRNSLVLPEVDDNKGGRNV